MFRNIKILIIHLAILLPLSSLWAKPLIYMPLGQGNQVIEIDATTHKIKRSFSGVTNAHGLVSTADGEYLIAGSLDQKPLKTGQPKTTPNSQLYLIHPAHGHVMSTIPVSGATHHLAITKDGKYVISSHPAGGNVSFYDIANNKIARYVKTGFGPNDIVISKDGSKAYVSNSGSNSITEIDLKTFKTLRTLKSGPAPAHMVISKNGETLFVVNPRVGKISFVSIKSGKVVKDISFPKDIHGLDISEDGNTLFISSKKANKLFSYHIKSEKKSSLDLSPSPYNLNIIKGTGNVYVSSREKPLIWVVNQKTLKVVTTIKLPAGEGHQIAIVN